MAHFIDKDPSGMETWINDDDNPGLTVRNVQDVEFANRYTAALRNDSLTDSHMKDGDMWLYASLQPIHIMDMKLRFGVDLFNKNHRKRAMELINTEYKHCKTTQKVHTVAR